MVILLKIISLGRGASGVRWQVIKRLEIFLQLGLSPMVPEKGSVGASGDLAPLAHLTAVLLGEGYAIYKGSTMPASEALKAAGLEPLELGPKEGLGMINGTQVSTALALAALFDSWSLAQTALVSGAMTTDALMGLNRAISAGNSRFARITGSDRCGGCAARSTRWFVDSRVTS